MEIGNPFNWWVDIENAAGDKLGDGPVLSGISWQQNRPLDKAGTFTFLMSPADPKKQYITHKRVLRVWGMLAGVATELGLGIVDKIRYSVDNSGRTVLEISGDDILSELGYRSVGSLRLASEVDQPPDNAIYHVPSTGSNTVLSNTLDGNTATSNTVTILNGEYLYIRHSVNVDGRLTFDLGATVNTNTATMSGQFFDGSGWVSLSGFADTTLATGKTLAQDGAFTWTTPTNARLVNHNNEMGYWVRFTPSADLTAVQIRELTIPGLAEFIPDVDEIMSLAPAGWTIDTGDFYDTTADGTYQQFSGESVLSALVATAQKTGEHFRLGVGRELAWLQNDTDIDSGIRAVQNLSKDIALEGNSDICLILSLEEIEDSYSLISRVYPYGSGNGGARVTLANCTITPPAGYTLDTVNNYLKHDDTETNFGRIEVHIPFKDIVNLENDAKSRESASNQLYNAAFSYLRDHKDKLKSYALSVTKLDQILYPGQTIRVVYYEEVDGYVILDIDTDLIILETFITLDASGISTTDLTVATIPRYPMTDAELMAEQITMLSNYEAHQQPVDPVIVLPPPDNPADGGWNITNSAGSKTLDVSTALDVNTADVLASVISALKLQGIFAD